MALQLQIRSKVPPLLLFAQSLCALKNVSLQLCADGMRAFASKGNWHSVHLLRKKQANKKPFSDHVCGQSREREHQTGS